MTLNIIWYILFVIIIAGYLILDGFDLGVGILHLTARNDHERRLMINSIGPLWDGNEVWLVTFGGAMFAAFPHMYATLFSGFYLALVLLLLAVRTGWFPTGGMVSPPSIMINFTSSSWIRVVGRLTRLIRSIGKALR